MPPLPKESLFITPTQLCNRQDKFLAITPSTPSPCILVMTHGGAQKVFNEMDRRDLYHYQGCDTLVTCPKDSIIETQYPIVNLIGRAGHHSSDAIHRFLLILTFLSALRYERYVILEYDSFINYPCVPEWIFQQSLAGNWFYDAESKFDGPGYVHPPLAFSHDDLGEIITMGWLLFGHGRLERGFWDRFLGLVMAECISEGMLGPGLSYGGMGYSKNTIETEEQMKSAMNFMFIHGVKNPEWIS